MPSAAEETQFQEGEAELGCTFLSQKYLFRKLIASLPVGIWGFRYTLECMFPVVEATLATKPPSYRTILDIDAKIRAFSQPKQTSSPYEGDSAKTRQTFVRSHYEELSKSAHLALPSTY